MRNATVMFPERLSAVLSRRPGKIVADMTRPGLLAIVVTMLFVAPAALGEVGKLTPVKIERGKALASQRLSVSTQAFSKAAEGCGAVNPHAVVARVPVGKGEVLVAIDSAKPDAPQPDVIRFDFSGQGKFADAPTLPLKAESVGGNQFCLRFGPATVEVRRGGRVFPVSVDGHYAKSGKDRQLGLSLAAAVEGTCRFGQKVCKVRIIDGQGNLSFQDVAVVKKVRSRPRGGVSGDTLEIAALDGSFDEPVFRGFYGQCVLLDGTWYDVEVRSEGLKVSARPTKAPMGAVQIDHDRWNAQLLMDGHVLYVSGQRLPVPLPAGEYFVMFYEEYAGLGEDRPFGTGIHLPGGRLSYGGMDAETSTGRSFKVAAGKTTKLAIGSPLTASVAVGSLWGSADKPVCRLSLKLTDALGTDVKSLGMFNWIPSLPPKVAILDANGKAVHVCTLASEGGRFFSCRYSLSWSVPASLVGQFTAVVDYDAMAFPVKCRASRFRIVAADGKKVLEPVKVAPADSWDVIGGNWPQRRIQDMRLNFGAPGDRTDATGAEWLAYPRPEVSWARAVSAELKMASLGWHRAEGKATAGKKSWLHGSGVRGQGAIVVSLLSPQEEVAALRCEAPPKIDGSLDDACWRDAQPVRVWHGDGPRTELLVSCDAKCLYFACRREAAKRGDERVPFVANHGGNDDDECWKDDEVEVFLSDGNRKIGLQFGVSAAGGRFDGRSDIPRIDWCDKSWDGKWMHAVGRGDAEAAFEIAIPLATLKEGGLDVSSLRMNFMSQNLSRVGPVHSLLTDPGGVLFGRCQRFLPIIVQGEKLPPALYTVRLHFAGPEAGDPGKCVFGVKIAGKTVARDLDVAKSAGGPGKPVVREFRDVSLTDTLKLELVAKEKQPGPDALPVLNGLEVIQQAPQTSSR